MPMSEEEVRGRLRLGESPLELSIEKWRRVRWAIQNEDTDPSRPYLGLSLGIYTCALCIDARDDCYNCCIEVHGYPSCFMTSSVYHQVVKAYQTGTKGEWVHATGQMIEFLEGLRKDEDE